MIIEYELNGSKALHKGLFDSQGFWVRFEAEIDEMGKNFKGDPVFVVAGYKLFSHFSFNYYHEDEGVVRTVYKALIDVLSGKRDQDIAGVGYIREVY